MLSKVKQALKESKDPDAYVKLSDIRQFERQQHMDLSEKILDASKDTTPYKDSRLQQHFSAIKSIRNIRGFIYIEVDELDSLNATKLKAFRVLGPMASPEEYRQYISEHTLKSVLLSVPKFVRNLRIVLNFAKTAPQYFGSGSGGGTLKDIIEESMGAIRDAREYLRLHRHNMPELLYEYLRNSEMQTNNKAEFVKYLGDDWESALIDSKKAQEAEYLIVGK
jgi:hypothetical protein